MSHEIDQSTGQAAVFVTGDPPWHGLGKVISHAATSQEALQLAGLDWNVEQWPLTASRGQHSQPAPHHVANVRSDTNKLLGVVSERYKIFQNREAIEFMDALVNEKLAMYETAGSLSDGRRVWMLARLPAKLWATPHDEIHPYVLLTNNHDGLGSLRLIPTTVRVVCQNTLNLALGHAGRSGLAIRHSANLAQRVAEAREKLGIVTERLHDFRCELKALVGSEVSVLRLQEYFDGLSEQLIPLSTATPEPSEIINRRRDLQRRWEENFENPRNTLDNARGSWWGAFNAVSEWADHQRTFAGTTDLARRQRRLASVWFGDSDRIKQEAFASAKNMAFSMN